MWVAGIQQTFWPSGETGDLTGANCPHYDGEPERRPTFNRLLREGKIGAGVAADDGGLFTLWTRRCTRW